MQLHTHIMFQDGQARDAAACYAALPGGELLGEVDHGGTIAARVRVAGQEIVLFDSPVQHEFGLTPAMSLVLVVDSASQVDEIVQQLTSDGGAVLMPVDKYDFAERFGWCVDRFGVSWQITSR